MTENIVITPTPETKKSLFDAFVDSQQAQIMGQAASGPAFTFTPDSSKYIKNGDRFMIWVPMAFWRRKNMDDPDEVQDETEYAFSELSPGEQKEVRDFFSMRSREFIVDFEGYVFDQLTQNSDRNGGTSWNMKITAVKIDPTKNELYMTTQVIPTPVSRLAETRKILETTGNTWEVRKEKVPLSDVENQIQDGLAKQTSASEYPYFQDRDKRRYKNFGRNLFVFLDGQYAEIMKQ